MAIDIKPVDQVLAGIDNVVSELQVAIQTRREMIKVLEAELKVLEARNFSIAAPDFQDLSVREITVTKMMVDGATNKEIAKALSISETTVKAHIRSILGKLKAKSRTEAAVKALQLDILSGKEEK